MSIKYKTKHWFESSRKGKVISKMSQKMCKVHYISNQGTPYEAGYQLGKKLLGNEELIRFMTSPFMRGPKLSAEKFETVKQLFDKFSPGLSEEIRGFADAVGADT